MNRDEGIKLLQWHGFRGHDRESFAWTSGGDVDVVVGWDQTPERESAPIIFLTNLELARQIAGIVRAELGHDVTEMCFFSAVLEDLNRSEIRIAPSRTSFFSTLLAAGPQAMLEDAGITGMPEVIRRVIARELGAPAGHGLMAYSWSLTHDPALRAQVLSDSTYWNIPLNSAVKEQLDRVNS